MEGSEARSVPLVLFRTFAVRCHAAGRNMKTVKCASSANLPCPITGRVGNDFRLYTTRDTYHGSCGHHPDRDCARRPRLQEPRKLMSNGFGDFQCPGHIGVFRTGRWSLRVPSDTISTAQQGLYHKIHVNLTSRSSFRICFLLRSKYNVQP